MDKVRLRPHYQTINGLLLPASFSPKCVLEAMGYAAQAGDVFIDTYPKCGTTWMQNMVLYVFRKGAELEDPHRQFLTHCPFIDAVGQQGIERMPRPGALKTHLPHHLMPYSPDAKYVYVLRNPKDCCVSLYYHTRNNGGFGYWDASFDDFFELFMAGQVEYGDYFDHLASWEGHRREDPQVFFSTFEEMKADAAAVVLRLARFLGREYSEAIEADSNVLRNILRLSSFEYMKAHLDDIYDRRKAGQAVLEDPSALEGIRHMVRHAMSQNPPDSLRLEFVRKGVVGDWRNHLSEEQSARLAEKFEARTRGTDIYDLYKDIMFK